MFYRGGWCPFCDLQLRAYQASLAAIQAHGATLVAISPQTPDYSLFDVEKKALAFPVLSDVGNRVARQYGLVVQFSDVLQRVQAAFDAPLPRFNGDDSWEAPTPAVFVVDRAGVVRLRRRTRTTPSASSRRRSSTRWPGWRTDRYGSVFEGRREISCVDVPRCNGTIVDRRSSAVRAKNHLR